MMVGFAPHECQTVRHTVPVLPARRAWAYAWAYPCVPEGVAEAI